MSISSDQDVTIPCSAKLRYHRGHLRDLTDQDPIVYGDYEPDYGVEVLAVQVMTRPAAWEPRDYRYQNNAFSGVMLAVEGVVEKESHHYVLERSRDYLDEHRKTLRRILGQR